MGMKILFVELPIDSWNRLGKHYLPNPGTLALATYMHSKGYEVKIIDSYAEGISWKKIPSVIKAEKPDIVASSTYTSDIYGRILLARIVKTINPSITTVFGGCHMTLVPEETMRLAKAIDYGIIGEGEETLLELTRVLESGRAKKDISHIKGLVYFLEDDLKFNQPRELIEDLDSLPLPDYSLLPMDKYRNSYFPFPAEEGFSCYFSRGCTSRCSFCSENILWSYRWRGRSAKSIIKELRILNEKYGKKGFLLGDDNFLHSRQRNIEFIEEMKHSGLNILFRAGARVDTLLRDRDLLPQLRNIGMVSLQIGIENYNQDVLNRLHKGYEAIRIRELMQELKKANITLSSAFMMIGHYDDNLKSITGITKTAKELGFGLIQISALTPWPGTELYREMRNKGLIKIFDYRFYNFKYPIARTRYLKIKTLQRLRAFLFYKWWFNIPVFLRNLKDYYRRHLHIYTITSIFTSALKYHLIINFRLWKFFKHNRIIDSIYKEHLAYMNSEPKD